MQILNNSNCIEVQLNLDILKCCTYVRYKGNLTCYYDGRLVYFQGEDK